MAGLHGRGHPCKQKKNATKNAKQKFLENAGKTVFSKGKNSLNNFSRKISGFQKGKKTNAQKEVHMLEQRFFFAFYSQKQEKRFFTPFGKCGKKLVSRIWKMWKMIFFGILQCKMQNKSIISKCWKQVFFSASHFGSENKKNSTFYTAKCKNRLLSHHSANAGFFLLHFTLQYGKTSIFSRHSANGIWKLWIFLISHCKKQTKENTKR